MKEVLGYQQDKLYLHWTWQACAPCQCCLLCHFGARACLFVDVAFALNTQNETITNLNENQATLTFDFYGGDCASAVDHSHGHPQIPKLAIDQHHEKCPYSNHVDDDYDDCYSSVGSLYRTSPHCLCCLIFFGGYAYQSYASDDASFCRVFCSLFACVYLSVAHYHLTGNQKNLSSFYLDDVGFSQCAFYGSFSTHAHHGYVCDAPYRHHQKRNLPRRSLKASLLQAKSLFFEQQVGPFYLFYALNQSFYLYFIISR